MAVKGIVIGHLSVILLLSVAYSRTAAMSKGFTVELASSPKECGDGWRLVLSAVGYHKVKLNGHEDLEMSNVATRLREVLHYRAEKVVYVKAERQVPFQEFVELVDNVRPDVQMISLLTPEVEAMARWSYCLDPTSGTRTYGRLH